MSVGLPSSLSPRFAMSGSDLVQIDVDRGVTVVSFQPAGVNLSEGNMQAVVSAFGKLLENLPPRVVIDLSSVKFFGSSFIEVMFRVWKRLQQVSGGKFAVAGANPYCREILEVTNLASLWSMHATREEAVDSLEQTP